MILYYSNYIYSDYYDPNRYVVVDTDGYKRTMRTSELCDEMDDNPSLICTTTVSF